MKTKYDPEIIGRFADNLYSQASSIIATRTLLGLLIGAGAGYGFATAIPIEQALIPVAIGALFGAWLGYSSAQARAFELRLRAQDALCQVQIEKNTRRD